MTNDKLYVCGNPDCDYEVKKSDIKDFHPQINICPTCSRERNLVSMLVTEEYYEKKAEREELAKRLYCRKCEKIDLIENFPFDAPEDDPNKERRCPRCGEDDLVNMGTVPMCDECESKPVVKGQVLCKQCFLQEQEVELQKQAQEELFDDYDDEFTYKP